MFAAVLICQSPLGRADAVFCCHLRFSLLGLFLIFAWLQQR